MKLKKNKKIRNKIIISLFFIFIFSILLIYYISNKVMPRLLVISENIVKEEGINLVSKNVSDNIIKLLDNKELFIIDKDNDGNIESIDYDTKTVNEILSVASKTVLDNYETYKKDKDNIVTYVPLFSVSNNIFLENLGPKVPLKLMLDGNVITALDTNVKEYGYNSALIEISVKIEANSEVVLPFKSKKEKIINTIPVSIKIVQGNVNSIFQR